MNNGFVARVVFASLALVAIFAVVFTWVDAGTGWPDLPPHFGRDCDLAAGFVFCAGVASRALRGSPPEIGEVG